MTLVSMSAFILFAQLVMGNNKFIFIEILKKIFKFVLLIFFKFEISWFGVYEETG